MLILDDGEEFATQLRRRLEREEPDIALWQDRVRMEGGASGRVHFLRFVAK